MKMTLLGTGAALVTEYYTTSFVLEENGEYFLVDGGGGDGIFRQLKGAGLNWLDLKTMFVTHKHTDHLLGIIWLIRFKCHKVRLEKDDEPFVIYGHEEVIRCLREISRDVLSQGDIDVLETAIDFRTVEDGDSSEILGHTVTFFDVRSKKAKQFGFTMDRGDQGRFTCCGDEPFYEHERPYAENSRWLMHEAFCLESMADVYHPQSMSHSSVKDACEKAASLHAENLILFHTEDATFGQRKELYTEEARQWFRGGIYVPDDLEVIELN